MKFGITGGGIGLIGGFVLFGGLMVAFTVVVTLIVRAVRGPDDPADPADEASDDRRAPEDDYII